MLATAPPSTLDWLAGQDLIPAIAWIEPSGEFDPAGSYVETYWLPVLGPSATLALRRITQSLADCAGSGAWLPVEPLARSLGLGSSAARNSIVRRAIGRIVDFRLAEIDHERGVLAVRTLIPRLSERAVERLPAHLAAQHHIEYPLNLDGHQHRDREAPPLAADRPDGRTRTPLPGPTIGGGTIEPTLDSEGALR